MNYKDTMKYITNTAKFGSNLGLSRTEKILELLGNPHKKIKYIHVAGTNGKGSVTAMISKILMESGFKVGMYTSPYLEEFEERIQINGTNISKEALSNIVTEVSKAVDKVIELGYDHPTEFEIITCTMFYYFYKEKVDFGVIEVGLGGRLDSTNVVQPYDSKLDGGVMASVIVSISRDHMNILGDTLEKIAYEKAGIIKMGVSVIMYPQEKSVEEVIEGVCKEKESNLVRVPFNCVQYVESEKVSSNSNKCLQKLTVRTPVNVYNIELSLLGKHQMVNCATAIFAIEEIIKKGFHIELNNIMNALKNVKWIGRLEVMKNKPLVVIDGAHNIDGITKLKENIQHYFKYRKMILILGILADKEVEKMVGTIAPMAEKIIAVTPDSYRAENANELEKVIKKYNSNCESKDNYEEAYKTALSYLEEEDILVISGSLYMIGGMRKIIRKVNKAID
ncbi:bifunctional folylpolyglutamate synthase/dihydrofolate synthase [Clostridium sp. P21]|uniref:tetrahydrofolate synthase n=1 Tax=Clostridium muellerianum TaxID=2716538 RepID=A0A7Y0HPN0_9CLOT|nr:folylpolyglutamate synthase/dihydrofolate synthase family protein [Clostridium muellerianum]NMM63181.1 bifunctional folylpolyglutamate synthase/dihydrofolate synthase [Clostridium muellerianum]